MGCKEGAAVPLIVLQWRRQPKVMSTRAKKSRQQKLENSSFSLLQLAQAERGQRGGKMMMRRTTRKRKRRKFLDEEAIEQKKVQEEEEDEEGQEEEAEVKIKKSLTNHKTKQTDLAGYFTKVKSQAADREAEHESRH